MPIDEHHKSGIKDILINEPQNIPVLLQLAKSVTKGVCEISTELEAFDYLLTYVDDVHKLLNKRLITKELLFKYLHSRTPNTITDFTKSDLIKHIIIYWNQQYCISNTSPTESVVNFDTEANFPINLLARKFSNWFFENYNKSNLQLIDFWPEVNLHLSIYASDGVNEYNYISAEQVMQGLMQAKQQFGFFFNPNLTHEGVQGRMDSHGLVLVLACGTLHTEEKFVGVFECVFGLLRDPYAENNWKMKRIQCILRSEQNAQIPSLQDSKSLYQALTLPTPSDELT